ncbi:MAG TPA: response regulator [Alphaproteobacteria bacterium]|jgi:two-component system chemotaxis sensor kinase CheA
MANRNEEIEKRLQATFRIEAEGHLQAINAELDSLVAESVPPELAQASLEILFRTMHTLKGAARSVGFSTIEALCQRCEAVLSDATKRRIAATPAMFAILRDATDGLAVLLSSALPPDRLDQIFAGLAQFSPQSFGAAIAPPPLAPASPVAKPASRPEPEPAPAPPPSPTPARAAPRVQASATPVPEAAESIRVEVSRLDRLVTLTEDLLIPKLVASERMRLARDLLNEVRHLRSALPVQPQAARRGDGTDADEVLGHVEAMAQQLSLSLAEDYKALGTVVDNLVGETRRARMMPAASILEAFPRMVRDLCRETGKDVTWRATGADVEIDRKILDIVKDPLIHLVRNAVDHGIETPNDRVAAGKPARGNVSLHIESLDEGHVRIEIADDGQGMGTSEIREAALRSRTLTPDEIGTLDDGAILELAFHAGVSTSPVISSLSGHGLGLSIVRERVERLDGKVRIARSSAQGTTIQIDLPVSIATYRGLLVDVSGAALLWPLDSVERAIGVPADAVQEALSSRLFVYENETLPFVRLASVLGLSRLDQGGAAKTFPCIVAKAGDKRGVFLVDGIAGEHEVLIKDLQSPLRRLRNVAAVGLMGTGELVLVLRPSDILQSMHLVGTEHGADAAAAEVRTRRILVVDDSITTRTMERNLFESAGYRVRVAADGLEAWNLLQAEEIDLVVSDIDMPRMNGFELTARIRSEQKTSALPIVLVTALESREDKKRGIEVGANAYVLKSTFDQSNLIEIVGRLL